MLLDGVICLKSPENLKQKAEYALLDIVSYGRGEAILIEPAVAIHEIRVQWLRERIDNAVVRDLVLK